MRIALFVIATGSYIEYVCSLLESADKYFLTDHEVDYFVFTDAKKVPCGATRVYTKHKPFPYPTLMRYNIIHDNRYLYSDYDCYFYCDADMLFVDVVGDEVLGELMGTLHPGFANKRVLDYAYERDETSSAYIKKGDGDIYYCGGFNGGRKYLEMANIIRYMVNVDLYKGHIPEWHDESYLNKYMLFNPPDVVLSPSYCYPEADFHVVKWGLAGVKPKLIALDKHNIIKSKYR